MRMEWGKDHFPWKWYYRPGVGKQNNRCTAPMSVHVIQNHWFSAVVVFLEQSSFPPVNATRHLGVLTINPPTSHFKLWVCHLPPGGRVNFSKKNFFNWFMKYAQKSVQNGCLLTELPVRDYVCNWHVGRPERHSSPRKLCVPPANLIPAALLFKDDSLASNITISFCLFLNFV